MKFIYIVVVYLCLCILKSEERITSHKITEIQCEDSNYKIYCANATKLESEVLKSETHYTVKKGKWEKVYVKQCIHEITKNGETKKECRPCYYKTYQEVCKHEYFDVYCNVKNFEDKYCKKIEYIAKI